VEWENANGGPGRQENEGKIAMGMQFLKQEWQDRMKWLVFDSGSADRSRMQSV
jgi:hypothetical protein